jgi:hypothetical protein
MRSPDSSKTRHFLLFCWKLSKLAAGLVLLPGWVQRSSYNLDVHLVGEDFVCAFHAIQDRPLFCQNLQRIIKDWLFSRLDWCATRDDWWVSTNLFAFAGTLPSCSWRGISWARSFQWSPTVYGCWIKVRSHTVMFMPFQLWCTSVDEWLTTDLIATVATHWEYSVMMSESLTHANFVRYRALVSLFPGSFCLSAAQLLGKWLH